MPIREVGRSGERKNPSGRRKKRKKARTERLGPGLKYKLRASHPSTKLSTKIYGTELGAKIYGAKLPAMSPPRLRRAQELGVSNDGAELRVQILKSYLQGHICERFSKKGLKIKKNSTFNPYLHVSP